MARPTLRLAMAFTFLATIGVYVGEIRGQCLSGCTCSTGSSGIACDASSVCPESLEAFYVSISLTGSRNCGTAINRASFAALTHLQTLRLTGVRDYVVIEDFAFADTQLQHLTITETSVQNLTADSLSGLSNLTDLHLSGNAIRHLPDNVFDDLGQLSHLRLSDNQLTSLSDHLFTGLSQLTTLDLTNNSIGQLSPACFRPLTALKSLKLSHNLITTLPGSFLDKVPITSLIVDNNQLVTIDPDAFSHSRLVGMMLENNRLDHVPGKALQKLQKVMALHLGRNNIVKVAAGDASNLTLGRVFLDNNPLKSVDADGFSGTTVETALSLLGTKLTSLPREMSGVLKAGARLVLTGLTGWQCDCHSLWLAQFLAGSNASSQPQCRDGKAMAESVEDIKALCALTTTTVTSSSGADTTTSSATDAAATATTIVSTLTGTTLQGVSAPTSASARLGTTISGLAKTACFAGFLYMIASACI